VLAWPCGAETTIANRPGGGARAEVRLPLASGGDAAGEAPTRELTTTSLEET
jgi:hypothetical protein